MTTLFQGPLTLHVWGLFVSLGILAATWVAARRGRRRGMDPKALWDLAFWVVLAGLLGARALYVAEYWRDFVHEPWRAFAFWEGGMSAGGAILAGLFAAWWYAGRHELRFSALAEVAGPPLLLGDAIGRLGGAASHMYQGRPTSFPISYVLDGVQRHEVGVELAFASLVGFLSLMGIERWRSGRYRGSRQQATGNRQQAAGGPRATSLLPSARCLLPHSFFSGTPSSALFSTSCARRTSHAAISATPDSRLPSGVRWAVLARRSGSGGAPGSRERRGEGVDMGSRHASGSVE